MCLQGLQNAQELLALQEAGTARPESVAWPLREFLLVLTRSEKILLFFLCEAVSVGPGETDVHEVTCQGCAVCKCKRPALLQDNSDLKII